MEEIRSELDETWVEEGNSRNLKISHWYMYPVDRLTARLTGHTKKGEIQIPINVPVKFTVQCTRSTGPCTRPT